jgi:hypothetical protein
MLHLATGRAYFFVVLIFLVITLALAATRRSRK